MFKIHVIIDKLFRIWDDNFTQTYRLCSKAIDGWEIVSLFFKLESRGGGLHVQVYISYFATMIRTR